MVQRTRTRNRVRIGGTAFYRDPPIDHSHTTESYEDYSQTTSDYVQKAKRPDGTIATSNFDSTRMDTEPGRFTKIRTSGWCMENRVLGFGDPLSAPELPRRGLRQRTRENDTWSQLFVQKSHPFLAEYSVPVAIKELAEVAGMFKLVAKTFAGFVGGAYLNYRFGWKTFLDDVRTLHSITKNIEHRIREFEFLLKHGQTRKRLQVGVWNNTTVDPNVTIHSVYATLIKGRVTTTRHMKMWITGTWGVTGQVLLPVDELSRFNLAVQTAFDLGEVDAITLWEMVPFSWLVDYFYSIGPALAGQHMRYQLQAYDICIMRHYVVKQTVVAVPQAGVTIHSPGFRTMEIKTRDAWSAPNHPLLSFDLISKDRWKVLLALIAKFRDK